MNKVTKKFTLGDSGFYITATDNARAKLHIDEDDMTFYVDDVETTKITNDGMNARNVATENQVSYYSQWATRKGKEVTGVGCNLNDMWIGG